jgi:hypothetical protein
MRARLAACLLAMSGAALAQQEPAAPRFAVLFNPLGFLQLGPNLEAEAGLGRNFGIALGVRIASLGLVSHLIDDTINFVWTGTGTFRIYPQGKGLEGWFVGPRVELGSSDSERYTSFLWGGGTDFGYRWTWPSGFAFGLGGQGGAFVSDWKRKSDATDTGRTLYVFAMFVVSIGAVAR